MADAGRSGRRSSAVTACATWTSRRSRRGGTRMPTSAARSRRSPTWAAAGGSGSWASATPSPRSPTSSRACGPSASCRDAGRRPMRALRFHAARDLRIEDVAEPSAPGAGRGRRAGRDLRHLRHRPARVHGRPDRDARRAASADRRAEPADPRPRVRGRRRRDRARRDERRRGRPGRDHAARVLRSVRVLPARAAAPLRDDGMRRALARLGRDGRARDGCRVPGRPPPRGGRLPARGADRADGGCGVRRRTCRRGARRPRAGDGRGADRRARCALRALRRRLRRLHLGAESRAARAGRGARGRHGSRPHVGRRAGASARARRTVWASTWRSSARGIRTASRRPCARSAVAARSRKRACSSARRPSSPCSGRSTT